MNPVRKLLTKLSLQLAKRSWQLYLYLSQQDKQQIYLQEKENQYMKKPQIITINGAVVLGSIATTDAGTIISDSWSLGQVAQVSKSNLADYIAAANVGSLDKPITVTGQGAMFSVRDLDDDLELEFQILTMKYAQAEKQAVPKLINKEFRSLI